MKEITTTDMAVLKHALGLDRNKKPYRNHFAAAHDTDDYEACERLVVAGLMTKGNDLGYGDLFHATKAGEKAATDAVEGGGA